MSPSTCVRYPPAAAPGSVRATDMLGTGTAGLLFGTTRRPGRREPYRYLDFTGGDKPYLLRRIDNGVGKVTEITFGASTQHRIRDRDAGDDWGTFLPRAIQVVERIRHEETVTGRASVATMHYHQGEYDPAAQRFSGFGRVDTVEDHGPGTVPVLTRSFFHLGRPGEGEAVPPQHVPALRGQLYRKEVFGPDGSADAGKPYMVEGTVWGVRAAAAAADGREVLFPHTLRRSVERSERTPKASRLVTELEHDAFGNVTLERRRGIGSEPGEPEQVVEIHGAYRNDTVRWVLGLPVRRSTRSAGMRLDDVRMYYDGLPFGQSTQGLLTRRERLAFTPALLDEVLDGVELPALAELGYHLVGVGDAAEWWFDEYRVAHDARGSIVEHRDAMGNVTRIEYDAPHALWPVRCTNAAGHVHEAVYHPRLGAIARLTDPAGAATTFAYTPLGRVRREVRPGDSDALPTVEFQYQSAALPLSTTMVRRRASGETATRLSVSYYDGRGNTVQTRARLDDGRFQVTRREVRDHRDLTVEIHPAFVSPASAFHPTEGLDSARAWRFTFDALGRTTEVVNPAGQRSHCAFAPQSITFFDTQDNDPGSPFAGTPRVQHVDAVGRLVRVDEQTGTETVTTRYAYDPAGQLRRVIEAGGAELLSQRFDLAGRKLAVLHRDAGTRRFLYDARGKLALYADAAGRIMRWSFDAIGRTVAVEMEGEEVERFTYDAGTGDHLAGRMAEASDRAGRQLFSYDARGRLRATRRHMSGAPAPFDYAFAYDADDRPLHTTCPDGGTVAYTYDALGRVTGVGGLIDAVTFDDEGRRTGVEYASGLMDTRTYDALLGRLQEHALTEPSTGRVLFRQRFTYDSGGNVLGIDDARPAGPGVVPAPRAFEYDALNRLVRSHGGPAPSAYDHRFAYDPAGNMTRNEGWRPEPLLYDGTRLSGVQAGGGPETLFAYDAGGCLRARPGMLLRFDARDMLDEVERDDGVVVRFAYDHAGRRVRKRVVDPGGGVADTIYVGESFEVLPDGTPVRYVSDPDGGAVLVVRGGTPATTLHHDYLGNVILVRDAASGGARQVDYLAYGQHLDPADELGELLFAGKRRDAETGLYYFRMRYYDPVLGRFISPDPIAVAHAEKGRLRPLSLNPYAYALDNPLRFTDPNGLWTFWEGFLTVVIVAAVVVATALTFGAAGVIALGVGAAVGGLIGGLTTGSVDGALAGALLGFGIVATVLGGVYFGGLIGGGLGSAAMGTAVGGFVGGFSAGMQAMGFIPSVRQNDTYKDVLGYTSWLNPWTWPGHIVGGVIFIVNAVVYGVAYAVTWGDPPEWAKMDVSFEQGMIVTTGGMIRPDRAFNFGAFTNINPGVNPTDRAAILRHERGHSLNNAYFGVVQVGRLGAGSQEDSFWEQLAESNANPNVEGLSGNKDERRRAGGRGFGDVTWWNP